jgi:hypothetical protein
VFQGNGEPLWLSSGKVMERENKRNQKNPGLLPCPGTFLKKEKNNSVENRLSTE